MSWEKEIESILSIGVDKASNKDRLTNVEKKLLLSTYNKITGKKKREGCGNCYLESYLYFLKLSKNPNKNIMKKIKEPGLFAMEPGKKIYLSSDVITSENLTDEMALLILKKNPNGNIKLFSHYPENWRELVDNSDLAKSTREKIHAEPAATVKEKVKKEEEKVSEVDLDAYDQRRATLESKSTKDLQDFAQAMELPKKDWSKLKREKLIDYLLDQTK